jgi:hypothetical protein
MCQVRRLCRRADTVLRPGAPVEAGVPSWGLGDEERLTLDLARATVSCHLLVREEAGLLWAGLFTTTVEGRTRAP